MAGRGEQKTPGSGHTERRRPVTDRLPKPPSPWARYMGERGVRWQQCPPWAGTPKASECAVDERGDRPLRPVGHARGDVALLLGLRDALDQRLRDGELALQQPDRPFPEILRLRAEARRRHPVPGPPSAGGDLLGPPA